MAEFRGKKGHWVTTETGSHVFIESDGTFEEAIDKAFGEGSSKSKKYTKYESEMSEEDKEQFGVKTGDEFNEKNPQVKKAFSNPDENAKADKDDFDRDLEVAFKKYGPNDDAILDELRANGKDYGMSNGDLQSVVEAYTMTHLDDDVDEDYERSWGPGENVDDGDFIKANNLSKDQFEKLKDLWEKGRNIDPNYASWTEIKDYVDKYGYDDTIQEMSLSFEYENEDNYDNDNDMHYEKQPDGTIKESWSDTKYIDEKDLEDKAGSGALKHVSKKEEQKNKFKKEPNPNDYKTEKDYMKDWKDWNNNRTISVYNKKGDRASFWINDDGTISNGMLNFKSKKELMDYVSKYGWSEK